MDRRQLFDRLWQGYVAVTPQAERIHRLLRGRGETIYNDHVALRTYGGERVGLEVLARPFVDLGFRPREDYEFPDKGLTARYYQHDDPDAPKVFISQLETDRFSDRLRGIVDELVAQVPDATITRPDFPTCGRPWSVDHATYRELLDESEYAAWVAAFGYRANHFTIDVGRLRTFDGLGELNDFLVAQGFELNDAGGRIKGSPAQLLEQSSTRADAVPVELSDGTRTIRSCYYEFARRYRLPGGELFHGFVPGSADRLFESTDAG